jgi:hypothetical protein
MAQSTPYRRTLQQIRRENLNTILDQPYDRTRLALKLEVSQVRITHITKSVGAAGRPINETLARRIEEVLDLPAFSLDRDSNPQLLKETAEAVLVARDRFQGLFSQDQLDEITSMVYAHNQRLGRVDMVYLDTLVKLAK